MREKRFFLATTGRIVIIRRIDKQHGERLMRAAQLIGIGMKDTRERLLRHRCPICMQFNPDRHHRVGQGAAQGVQRVSHTTAGIEESDFAFPTRGRQVSRNGAGYALRRGEIATRDLAALSHGVVLLFVFRSAAGSLLRR
jgi:hypothetical protein